MAERHHGFFTTRRFGARRGLLSSTALTAVVLLAGVLSGTGGAWAANAYWDGGSADKGQNGAVEGGPGTWNATLLNWTDSGGTSGDSAWVAGDIAVFETAGGTVSVTAPQTIGGLDFEVTGYTLDGGAGHVLSSAGTPTINVTTGSANIQAITFTGGNYSKIGGGTLNFGGIDSFSGSLTVSNGAVDVATSASLTVGGGITNNATLGNDGAIIGAVSNSVTFNNTTNGTVSVC